LEGTAADDLSGVDAVTLTYTPTTAGLPPETVSAELTCDQVRTSCTWKAPPPALPGTYAVEVTATDRADNGSSGSRMEVTVI
ncbi:MAG: hypothetical protein WDA71_13805, partial [Actinomycetota bacterium]